MASQPVTDEDLARVRTLGDLGDLIPRVLAHSKLTYRQAEKKAAERVNADSNGNRITLKRSTISDMRSGRAITEDRLRLLLFVCDVPQRQVRKWLTALDQVADRPAQQAAQPGQSAANSQSSWTPTYPAVARSHADIEVGLNVAISASAHEAAPPRPVVTTALGRDVAQFFGRHNELQRIVTAAEAGRGNPIYTVDGMPGVGKTALVTHAAHKLAPQYPDGQYFVELHAHTAGRVPADPAEVLAGLLSGLGIDPRSIPDTLHGRRDLWRDQLTGKKVLLVLDDARDHDQIEPLLPSGTGCLTLVTSRSRLVALDGATPLALNALDPVSAADLFITLAGRAETDTERAAVDRIVRLCGHLPLAIVVLAGRLAHHPLWTIAKLADEFATTTDRLAELGTRNRAVRAAFILSYQDLPAERQQLFRWLGLNPGVDVDAIAVAALACISVESARSELEDLYNDHLLDETTKGRYTLHDLLRVFAGELAAADPAEDTDSAVDRLLDYYHHTAANLLGAIARESGDQASARSWIRSEHANLIACLDYAITNRPTQAITYAKTLAVVLIQYGPWPTAVQLYERTCIVASDLRDQLGEANTLNYLGIMQKLAGNYTDAANSHLKALGLYRELGMRGSEALALHLLGGVRAFTEDHAEAANLNQQALNLYRELRIPRGEALILETLGTVQQAAGNYTTARSLYEQALIICRAIGEQLTEAHIIFSLGTLQRLVGNDIEATTLHHEALALYRRLDHPLGEANTLDSLGAALRTTGDYAEAVDLYQRALSIYRGLGSQLSEARTLDTLGALQNLTGNFAEAITLHQQALVIHQRTGEQLGEANARYNLGSLHKLTGDFAQAIDLFQQALPLYRKLGNKTAEANTLGSLGTLQNLTGNSAEAITLHQQALALYFELGSQLGEANARYNLGSLHKLTGDFAQAIDLFQQALPLYRKLGNKTAEANTLDRLGTSQLVTVSSAEATNLHQQALNLYRELGNKQGEANALDHLGTAQQVAGNYAKATELHQQALGLYRELNNQLGEAIALDNLGTVQRLTGSYTEATKLHRRALNLFRKLGDRFGSAQSLRRLGVVQRLTGNYTEATELHQQALSLYRELGSRFGEALSLGHLGTMQRLTGNYTEAAKLHQQALIRCRAIGSRLWEAANLNEFGTLLIATGKFSLAQDSFADALTSARLIGSQLEQAYAFEGIARCHAGSGATRAAVVELTKAIAIYRRLGAPELGSATTYLAGIAPDMNSVGMSAVLEPFDSEAFTVPSAALDGDTSPG
ncbi:tetratricopeptide repeat protein [Nocardia sp. bgisy118]|uniref:tetratricopeptide repeat protein n=1 Tax=Nocardia sp. bgisy118 TaxID=3413786 RepID=UPI003F4A8316